MIIKELHLNGTSLGSKVKINNVSFDRLNVLVGVSGAGKTTIISGLSSLISLAEGGKSRTIEWTLHFEDDLKRNVFWKGQLSQAIEYDAEGKVFSKFVNESLTIDGTPIFSRDEKSVIFSEKELPRLDDDKSLLFLLRQSTELKDVFKSLTSAVLISVDSELFSNNMTVPLIDGKIHKEVLARNGNLSIKKLSAQFKELTCREKIYYAFKYDKDAFDELEFIYTNIFPEVKKITPRLIKTHTESSDGRRVIFIELDLKNGQKINQSQISSGMFKAMMLLSELQFGNNNSPIIIDEIENSLGVNCLPDILSELQQTSNQVIITSHHPRVINDIPKSFWKVVSRGKNGDITTYPASEVLDFDSNHDNFLLLMNSNIYRGYE
ncbi:AAA family ATPase [Vibrio sp. 10N.222.54.F6]|uniref:AAA family ATPase n=1 Tax=unclassified Vibrio TaxID=2614977 RepID=UPI000C841CEF|nr:AAA family ATPase [Vibrio sp. 10N.261.51.A7]PML67570.1 hypothetical protein BCT71_02325 [Vibrio sp. 10N.261.51.A7]